MAEVDRVMDDTIAKQKAGTLPPSVYHAWREANPRPAPQRPPEPAKASS